MRRAFCLLVGLCSLSAAAEIASVRVAADLSKAPLDEALWKGAAVEPITLMAQPMINPRPATTTTAKLDVQSVHDGKWIAFRFKWAAKSKNEAGRLGEYSDAVAVMFPVRDNNVPPPVFMGALNNPVHIFHWRAQYQRDLERGKPGMKDLYPNMNPDMYPLEFKDAEANRGQTDEGRDAYAYGRAAGNPQSFAKHGVDEIVAEGFSTSAVIENTESAAKAEWKNGEWTVVIARALKREHGSTLEAGGSTFAAFAVWQGAQAEVASRKSVTMTWTPVRLGK